jgi:multicomponent Na+:H+ antiporter subunit E
MGRSKGGASIFFGRGLRGAAARLIFFSLLWAILTQGAGGWIIGAPSILLATLLSLGLHAPIAWRWRPMGVLRFVPYFLWQSLRGGIDVTLRALHPSLPIDPAMVDHTLSLPPGPSQVFLANTINLLPGTLSVDLHEGHLKIHMLDAGLEYVMELKRVEERVADLFGVELAPHRR